MRSTGRVLGLAVLCAVLASPAGAGELSRDEVKWVRACLKSLGANSAKVRAGAEAALVAMGSDALDTIHKHISEVKGFAAEKGLGRVLAGIGRERVQHWLAEQREKNGSTTKKLDRIESLVGGAMAPGEPMTVPLAPDRSLDWRRVPFAAEHEITSEIPRRIAGRQTVAKTEAKGLYVDLDGSGTAESLVPAGDSRLLELGLGSAKRPVLVYDKLGTWYCCSARVISGSMGKLKIRLLDADMDGRFGGADDFIRIGDGGWVRQRGWKRITTASGPADYDIDDQGDEPSITITPRGKPAGISGAEWRALIALNQFRSMVGRPALIIDDDRMKGCRLHAKYLASNAATDKTIAEGGNSHGEDPSKPGYTEEGATAGASSCINGGRLEPAIWQIARTMLHRIHWLAPSTEGVGLGHSKQGKQEWCVIWCGDGDATEHGSPIAVPGPGDDQVERRASGEWPPPDSPAEYYKKKRGYPISMTYEPLQLKDVRLTLYHSDGKTPVHGHMWSTEAPIAKSHATNGGSAFFVPLSPLDKKTDYWVVFSARRSGVPIRHVWTFKTR